MRVIFALQVCGWVRENMCNISGHVYFPVGTQNSMGDIIW